MMGAWPGSRAMLAARQFSLPYHPPALPPSRLRSTGRERELKRRQAAVEEREREAAAGWQSREGELAAREQALLAERQALEEAAAEFEVGAGGWGRLGSDVEAYGGHAVGPLS